MRDAKTSGAGATFMHVQNHERGRNYDLHLRSIERVIRTISGRLHQSMSNEEMADIACFSPCHFNRLFHRVTGIPPIQFHYALRIARAKELLIETDLSITDICFEVGYNSLGTFVSRFSELVGVPPSSFRRLARRISGMSLADLRLPRLDVAPLLGDVDGIAGTIDRETGDGIVFTGLFRRAIPEGRPSACAIVGDDSEYVLPLPPSGLWYVLSVAVPLSADSSQLLTLSGLARGRSSAILVQGDRWYGDTSITLSAPSSLDPPILAAIPIQLAHLEASAAHQA